jgi:hypothetical protein
LIVLGRPKDAEPVIAEVERHIADGTDTNINRPRRLARLRALAAATQGQFDDVEKPAALARSAKGAAPDITDVQARLLAEYAAAQRRRSKTPAATLLMWAEEASSPESRAELAYWVAHTLRARGEGAKAHQTIEAARTALGTRGSPELHWRLAALSNLTAPPQIGATIPPRTPQAENDETQKLKALWGAYDSTPYFARADLKPLLGRVQ